jgi:hypothetical protein
MGRLLAIERGGWVRWLALAPKTAWREYTNRAYLWIERTDRMSHVDDNHRSIAALKLRTPRGATADDVS